MASSGPNNPGTLGDDSGTGTVAWTNPGNAASSNDSYATGDGLTGTTTHYLKATNFGFSIDSGATIDGIKVEIEKGYTGASMSDARVRIVKGGTIGSTDKSAGAWSASDAYTTYGGTSDLWGETWSPSDINASNFGVVISATGMGQAKVDHIRITIYYSTLTNYTITASQGSFTLSGQSVTLKATRILVASNGSFTESGQSTNLLYGRKVICSNGAFTLTGQDVTLLKTWLAIISNGSFTLSGQNANLVRGLLLGIANGAFTLSGKNVVLTYSGGSDSSSGEPVQSKAIANNDLIEGCSAILGTAPQLFDRSGSLHYASGDALNLFQVLSQRFRVGNGGRSWEH